MLSAATSGAASCIINSAAGSAACCAVGAATLGSYFIGIAGSVTVSGFYSTVIAGIVVTFWHVANFAGIIYVSGVLARSIHIAGIMVTRRFMAPGFTIVGRFVAMVAVVGHIAVTYIVVVKLVSDFVSAFMVTFIGKMHIVMGLLVISSGTGSVVGVNPWRSRTEETVACITVVDCEIQHTLAESHRSVEVFGIEEKFILPAGKYISEFICTAAPVDSEDVSSTNQTIEIVEIDFIDSVVLVIGKVQFIGHLVGEEKRFAACPFVAHSVSVHHCCDYDRGNE